MRLRLLVVAACLSASSGQDLITKDDGDSPESSTPSSQNAVLTESDIERRYPIAVKSDSARPVPKNLVVLGATQRSISLKWDFDPKGKLEGYRIYYTHENSKDVKTNMNITPAYELHGLEPYTQYHVWVEAIVDGFRTAESEKILANTDVDQPGKPILKNVTCLDTGKIFVEWSSPERFDKSVDSYELFYRSESESNLKSVTIVADTKEEHHKYVIEDLEGNNRYIVQIRAGTKSLSNPEKTWFGEATEEKSLYLPTENCKPGIFEADFRGELSAGMIVGAVCAVLFLFLAVIGFVIWRQYFKAAYYYLDEPQRMTSGNTKELPNWEEELGPDGGKGAIPLAEFADHVASLHVDSDIGFSKEYEDIQKHCLKDVKAAHDHSSHPDNKCKNRYLNIVAYDQSRVRLMPFVGQKKTSDYINANFIDGYQKCNAYIGTQGPLEHTFEAFWRMVWEQNVYVIVMITNLVERGRRKCDRYWPKEDTETYSNIEVNLLKEESMANYTVRTFKIKHLKLKRKKGCVSEREIFQFHFTSWPDHGVPSHALPVLTYIRKSVDANPPEGGPIVVHCSAGVGRTGTYIAIDAMLKEVEAKGEFNIYGFLKHIRGQRNYLVQTEEQYVFIHDALLEATVSGVTEICRENLADFIDKLLQPTNGTSDDDGSDSKRLIDRQFELVSALKPSEYHYSSARMDCNLKKNRSQELIPVESSRIPLAPKPGVEGSDYINASWLHGHNKVKEFILSQHPTDEIHESFWRMLWDHNAQTVVLLSSTDLEGFTKFWPEKENDFDLETFRVRFIEEAVHEGHSTYDFVVSSQHDDYELAVRIIYCPEWPRNVPKLEEVFSVLKVVQDWHLEYQDGPLVVVDKYGGTEGATFCALTTLCKELDTFNAIDVYQVAKLYHNKRPGIWKSPDDVLYLYKAVEALIASNRANPVHDETTGIVVIDIDKPATTNGVTPERRISPSRANGAVVKSSSGHGFESATTEITTEDESLTTSLLRRHSLPTSTAAVVPNGDAHAEEEDEDNETTALTSSNKELVDESKI